MDKEKEKSKTKLKSKSKTLSKEKSLSKSLTKNKSISKSKSVSKSISKSISKSVSKPNNIIIKIHREEGELDHVYQMRIAFIKTLLENKKVAKRTSMIPYLHTFSFVHAYKTLYKYGYPKEIEEEYKKLL